SASLDQLLATPRLYGVTFDAYVTSIGNSDVSAATRVVRNSPDVDTVALAYAGVPFAINGHRVDGMAFTQPGSRLSPTITSGPDRGRRDRGRHPHDGVTAPAPRVGGARADRAGLARARARRRHRAVPDPRRPARTGQGRPHDGRGRASHPRPRSPAAARPLVR